MFDNRRYLTYLRNQRTALVREGLPMTHTAYGFPLTLYPGVYPCHPDFTHSASILIDGLPADMEGLRLLDMGTGNGVIAIEAARRGAQVLACDNEPAAVEAVRTNAGVNGVADRVRGVQSSLLRRFGRGGKDLRYCGGQSVVSGTDSWLRP